MSVAGVPSESAVGEGEQIARALDDERRQLRVTLCDRLGGALSDGLVEPARIPVPQIAHLDMKAEDLLTDAQSESRVSVRVLSRDCLTLFFATHSQDCRKYRAVARAEGLNVDVVHHSRHAPTSLLSHAGYRPVR
jgi:hypothetical protein